jgi:hypothetical protein
MNVNLEGADDNDEKYLGRTKDFGLIGIARNGDNPAGRIIQGSLRK